ncbi:ribosome small subunit-dependent GTPase A [Rubrivivax albus]|uniref:Small ribosomal subunit biogenesis GTPase RsgA n=1 Tax=Rubrivivax albus TaxID=2499835 RepID=A0A3S2U010_9BURK|nr:ribosome small subunit-dependent GTPase A [Rubrivivax albus]RVT48821.1 ribosome small subunit-dependent GTPase A [Rubrivivax albus]
MTAAQQTGLVVAAHGRHLIVESADGSHRLCHLRGKKTEAVVGDRVRWAISGDEGVVEALEPRRNLLWRQDEWRSKAFAANLDRILVLVAGEPMFSESQLTRALVAAAHAGIDTVIGLNKTDLPAADTARERLAPYRAMGVPVVELALKARPAESLAALQPLLASRTTLVLGPSGAGKSTLINRAVPGADAQVGEISQALGTGRHTTTSTRWYWLTGRNGALIDSPGFQAFGLHHVPATDLASLMPDLAPHLGGCRFYNCTHRHEPGCALRAAAERGVIAPSRWRLYGELFDELSAPQRY